jgi:hypothetical protein
MRSRVRSCEMARWRTGARTASEWPTLQLLNTAQCLLTRPGSVSGEARRCRERGGCRAGARILRWRSGGEGQATCSVCNTTRSKSLPTSQLVATTDGRARCVLVKPAGCREGAELVSRLWGAGCVVVLRNSTQWADGTNQKVPDFSFPVPNHCFGHQKLVGRGWEGRVTGTVSPSVGEGGASPEMMINWLIYSVSRLYAYTCLRRMISGCPC